MKRILSFVATLVLTSAIFSSCMKDEKPYVLPPIPVQDGEYEIKNNRVNIGETYETQVYFSLTNGVVSSSSYKDWDIRFSTGTDNNELWMNGGKQILLYPTGNTNFASVTSAASVPGEAWVYDNPSGLPGESGLGVINTNHVGEVIIVNNGENVFYKLLITEITDNAYKIQVGPIAAATGTAITLEKDQNYNYAFYSFTDGIVKPEPPKKDWDVLFTRYRHVYYDYDPDFLYIVNGVLTNPYKTQSADDSTKLYDFYDFTLEKAEAFELKQNVDVIGFDWKSVNINTGQYTVNAKRIFVIKDQNEGLWKLHFVNFYDDNGTKGYPQFEFQRLR